MASHMYGEAEDRAHGKGALKGHVPESGPKSSVSMILRISASLANEFLVVHATGPACDILRLQERPAAFRWLVLLRWINRESGFGIHGGESSPSPPPTSHPSSLVSHAYCQSRSVSRFKSNCVCREMLPGFKVPTSRCLAFVFVLLR